MVPEVLARTISEKTGSPLDQIITEAEIRETIVQEVTTETTMVAPPNPETATTTAPEVTTETTTEAEQNPETAITTAPEVTTETTTATEIGPTTVTNRDTATTIVPVATTVMATDPEPVRVNYAPEDTGRPLWHHL